MKGLAGKILKSMLRRNNSENDSLSEEEIETSIRDLRTPDSPFHRARREARESDFSADPSDFSSWSFSSWSESSLSSESSESDGVSDFNYLRAGVKDAVFQRVIDFGLRGNQIHFRCEYCGENFGAWPAKENDLYSDDFCNEVVKRHLPKCQGLMQVKKRRDEYLEKFPKHRKVRFG